MTNDEYSFDTSEFTDTEQSDEQMSTESDNPFEALNIKGLTLLPVLVVGVYAFVEQAVVLSAVETLIGASGLATAITSAFYIIGAVSVAGLALMSLATAGAILLALTRQSVPVGLIALIGIVAHGVLWAGATFVFTSVPLLVGVVLTLNAVVYSGTVVIAGVIIIGAIVAV